MSSSLRAGLGGEAAVALTVLVTDGVDASALTVLVTGKTNIPTNLPHLRFSCLCLFLSLVLV
jgi:hypothetical protein